MPSKTHLVLEHHRSAKRALPVPGPAQGWGRAPEPPAGGSLCSQGLRAHSSSLQEAVGKMGPTSEAVGPAGAERGSGASCFPAGRTCLLPSPRRRSRQLLPNCPRDERSCQKGHRGGEPKWARSTGCVGASPAYTGSQHVQGLSARGAGCLTPLHPSSRCKKQRLQLPCRFRPTLHRWRAPAHGPRQRGGRRKARILAYFPQSHF